MENNNNNFFKKDIAQELRESYLQYAMSVIISRALPDARDGLKPVQRRILFAMYEDGLRSNAKFKKAANVVGSCMGRYHPHGDIAIYDTLVRMAQDFSLRYPLIECQGNIGSIDGDPPAAMRYLETRLAEISEEMLLDIDKETVDFIPNYDGTRKEPKVLPAKLPNLLINGAMGIAVGMATNIPPHNLGEVIEAIIHLIDNPEATIEDLMNYILGPDFPTGGIIYGQKQIKEAYLNGRGSILIRAKTEIIEEKKQFQIIIREIPYQVNKANLITTIARLVEEKKIEGIKDLRDESDKEGLRIVIDLKEEAIARRIQNQLFKYTELEKTFYLNALALVEDGLQPEVLSLKDILEEYLHHRKNIIYRRTRYLLIQAEARAHILEGLKKALEHIDEIIALIKASESREDAQKKLINNFKFTEIQAKVILETKLQTLAKLERQKINDELKEKRKLIEEYNLILKEPKRILKIIKDELQELKTKYSDVRKTKIIANLPQEIVEEDLIPQKKALLTLSQSGYIKRLPEEILKPQIRGGRGVIAYEAKDDDFLTHVLSINTHDNLWFFTNKGRLFKIKAYEIPEAQRTARGKTLQNYLNLPPEENVMVILNSDSKKVDDYLLLATRNGIVKKTSLKEYQNIYRNGLYTIKLLRDDVLGWANFCQNNDEIILVTKKGQAIRFKEKDVRSLGRVTAGVTGIKLADDDIVIGMIVISKQIKEKKHQILVISENGFGKRTEIKDFRLQKRGGVGIRTAKITAKTGELVRVALVQDEEFVITVSQKGKIIKSNLKEIPLLGRATQGVRIMRLDKGDKVSSIALI